LSGPLTALPFHLLVTDKSSAIPDIDHLQPYRDAAWLIKRQAITVLPSVASLQALRLLGHKDEGSKPMIGFGNPVFNPAAAAGAGRERGTRRAVSRLVTRSYTDFWQGVGVDRRQLAQSLPQLPETEDELKAVAANLGASPSDIFLGRDATVTAVKHAPLGDFRVVISQRMVSSLAMSRGSPSRRLRSQSRYSQATSTTASSPPAKLQSSSSTPTGWYCPPATRLRAASPGPKHFLAWPAHSFMAGHARFSCRIGQLPPMQRRG